MTGKVKRIRTRAHLHAPSILRALLCMMLSIRNKMIHSRLRLRLRLRLHLGKCIATTTGQSVAFIQDWIDRSLVYQSSAPLPTINGIQAIYLGMDPTAASLHIGHLLGLLRLFRAHICHRIPSIALIGGATASIGDPSGKMAERPKLSAETLNRHVKALALQIATLHRHVWHDVLLLQEDGKGPSPLAYSSEHFHILNNLTWWQDMKLLDFFSQVGTTARISKMLSRDSVAARLASPQGIGYAEFSYSLLQAYDYYFLNLHYGVNLQIGGADQWGNMTAGLDLVHKMKEEGEAAEPSVPPVFALTWPLLLAPNGLKFGKSEGNAIWLDPMMTSPFEFYQYWMQVPDDRAILYLKYFTFLPLAEIQHLEQAHFKDPGQFLAQKRLALQVTRLVHSASGLKQALMATELICHPDTMLRAHDLLASFTGTGRLFSLTGSQAAALRLDALLVTLGAFSSSGEAKKAILAGSVSVNRKKYREPFAFLFSQPTQGLPLLQDDPNVFLILIGKYQPYILRIVSL